MSIGTNIKWLRIQAGWSQDQLAERIGKTRAAVSQYEKDICKPRMGVVEDLATVFCVSKSAILEDSNPELILSSTETELIQIYRRLSVEGKHALLIGLRDYSESISPTKAGSQG